MSFPVGEAGQARLSAEDGSFEVVRVTRDTLGAIGPVVDVFAGYGATNPPSGSRYTYRVGPGDVLRVGVWDNPERRVMSSAGDNVAVVQSGVAPEGIVVDADGSFFYPFVGDVRALGQTVSEIREDLTRRLREYIANPQVEVSVEAFNARRATVTGAVENAGSVPITNLPVRLIDVLNDAETLEDANLAAVELRRHGRSYRVDVEAFLDRGDARQNPFILPDDLVYVPPLVNNKVFVFGEAEVGEVALERDGLSLLEVLAQVGGYNRVRADARGIFVFRPSRKPETEFTVYQFDLSVATALMLVSDFEMGPLDVVFVTRDPITRWNDTIGKLLAPVRTTIEAQLLAERLTE